MADADRNPERRSDAALLCLIIGGGLIGVAYFMGVGTVLLAFATGMDPVAVAGAVGAQIAAVLALVCGVILAGVGFVWILARVIADARGEAAKDRYSRDVER
jgi:hypothetical protein